MFGISRWALPAFAVGLALTVFFVWAASQGYPTQGGIDAFCYLTPALNFERGSELVAHACRYTAACDPLHQSRLLAYPPAFPVVLSLLMQAPTMQSALFSLQILQAITVLVGGFAASRVLERSSPHTHEHLKGWLLLLVVLALSSGFAAMGVGRPETLVQAVITAGIVLLQATSERTKPWLAGIFIGLLATTSPWGAVTGGMVFVWWRSLEEHNCLNLVRQVMAAFVCSVTVFLCFVPFFPASFSEMVQAASCVKESFGQMATQPTVGRFDWIYFLFLQMGAPGHPIVLAVAAALSLRIIPTGSQSKTLEIIGPLVRVALTILSGFVTLKYAFYVVAPWFPLALIVIARAVLLARREGFPPTHGKRRLALAVMLAALIALPSAGVARAVLGWVGYRVGVSRAGADAAVESLMSQLGDRTMGLDRTLSLMPTQSQRVAAVTNEFGQLRYHAADGRILTLDESAPPVALVRGRCAPLRVAGYRTVCLPWRDHGPFFNRWVDTGHSGWAFTMVVRDDAGLEVDELVDGMMCAAGDAAKPGSCRPR